MELIEATEEQLPGHRFEMRSAINEVERASIRHTAVKDNFRQEGRAWWTELLMDIESETIEILERDKAIKAMLEFGDKNGVRELDYEESDLREVVPNLRSALVSKERIIMIIQRYEANDFNKCPVSLNPNCIFKEDDPVPGVIDCNY